MAEVFTQKKGLLKERMERIIFFLIIDNGEVQKYIYAS